MKHSCCPWHVLKEFDEIRDISHFCHFERVKVSIVDVTNPVQEECNVYDIVAGLRESSQCTKQQTTWCEGTSPHLDCSMTSFVRVRVTRTRNKRQRDFKTVLHFYLKRRPRSCLARGKTRMFEFWVLPRYFKKRATIPVSSSKKKQNIMTPLCT